MPGNRSPFLKDKPALWQVCYGFGHGKSSRWTKARLPQFCERKKQDFGALAPPKFSDQTSRSGCCDLFDFKKSLAHLAASREQPPWS